MPNIGDLVTNLIVDASQHTRGTDVARGNNRALSGSIESLNGQLERQRRLMMNENRTTRDNILSQAAKPGVTEGQVNSTLQLHEEVEALKRKKQAEAEATAEARAAQQAKDMSARAGSNLLQSLQQEIALHGKSAAEIQIYTAAQMGVRQATLDAAKALQLKRDALVAESQAEADATAAKQRGEAAGASLISQLQQEILLHGQTADQIALRRAASEGASAADLKEAAALQAKAAALSKTAKDQADATAKQQAGKQAGESLVATLKNELATYGMLSSEMRQYAAAQAGASQADIKAARDIQAKIDQQVAFDRQIQRQIQTQRQATTATQGQSRGSMVLTESMRAAEDAVAGFTNNGLKGMLQATTNNVGQIGSLIGGMGGLYLQIGSVAALAATSLIPMLIKWQNGNEDVAESAKKLEEQQARNHEKEMARITEREARMNARKDRDAENQEIRSGKTPNSGVLAGVAGGERPTGTSLRDEEKRNKDEIDKAQREKAAAQKQAEELARRRALLESQGQVASTNVGGNYYLWDRDQKAREKELEDIKEKQQEATEARKKAAVDERNARQRLAETEKQREKTEGDEKIRERNRQNQELKANEREAEAELEEDRKARDARKLANQKTLASQLTQSLNQNSPGFAEKDALEQKRKEIELARKQGVITDDQAKILNAANVAKPDPVAPSAGANQAGSKEAYSSIVKNMKINEQMKLQEEAKKAQEASLKVLEDIRTSIQAQEDLLAVDF